MDIYIYIHIYSTKRSNSKNCIQMNAISLVDNII